MFGVKLNIVMLMFQPSVVARGLEKKLVELGSDVRPVVGDFSVIDSCIGTTDLFIFNLPTTIADDKRELSTLEEIGDLIIARNKKMILVGEKELYGVLKPLYDKVDRFVWVFRPVEMTELVSAVDKAMHGSKEDKMKRVLIVDDDPEYAKMVRGWIKDDYKVDIVTAGMQAITFLLKVPEDQKVDIILLDYEMPVVDGPQVFQMLRQEPATAHIPVVFLTGVGTRDGVERVMSLKPDGYILKSTTRENLLSFLQNKLK